MDHLTVIVPYFNGASTINRLLQSIPADLPVIVVDDQSDDPFICTLPNVTAYRPDQKLYFTGAVNYAIERCNTDVLILNQDSYLEGDAWRNMLAAERTIYALIGERIKGDNLAFPNGYVHGTFQFMRRDAIEAAGMMDAKQYPLWGASALWQWQICRKGYKSLPLATVPGFHHLRPDGERFGSSIQQLLQREPAKQALFVRTPPAVSVIIPAYNHGRYLPDALHSLIGGPTCLGHMPGQTLQSFEVIVVDDGSTDDTPAVMADYADGWLGIRYIRQSNQGTGAALNAGIRAAAATAICVMDADDMREPWSLADLYAALNQNPHSLIYDEPRLVRDGQRGQLMRLEPYNFETLLTKNMIHTGIMFPRQAWAEVGGYATDGAIRYGRQDWAFNVAAGIRGYCGVRIERSGYLYRRHEKNRTLTNTDTEWRNRFVADMGQRFASIYRGARPTMCCGRGTPAMQKKPNQPPQQAAKRAAANIDTDSMTLMEYIGQNLGSARWGGAGGTPTGRTYVFGANARDRIKYVDGRDVGWFLGRMEHNRPLFRRYSQPDPQPVEPAQPPPGPPEPEPETPTVEAPDPAGLTIAEIKALTLTGEQWAALYEMEIDGKARAGAVDHIKAQINAATD